MGNELAIIKQENIAAIVQTAPQAYNENVVSHDRCRQAGIALMEKISAQGMTDELDNAAALYIEKTRKTVKKMFEKRSATTQLFDRIRNVFTTLEKDIDPSTAGTVPYQLQALRNKYAAAKMEEEKRRQEETMRMQRAKEARMRYQHDCKGALLQIINAYQQERITQLRDILNRTTLESYDRCHKELDTFLATAETITDMIEQRYKPYCNALFTSVQSPEKENIADSVFKEEAAQLAQDSLTAIEAERDGILEMMPSKKMELERAAQASEEEAEQIKKNIAARETAEYGCRDAERIAMEEQRKQQETMLQKNTEAANLFDQAAASVQAYKPKTAVKKKMIPLNPEAFPEIISMWWAQEGMNLTLEELSKICKRQLTFCEKLANDKTNPQMIQSEHIYYKDEVKAK